MVVNSGVDGAYQAHFTRVAVLLPSIMNSVIPVNPTNPVAPLNEYVSTPS
jgi:hypothetical protein